MSKIVENSCIMTEEETPHRPKSAQKRRSTFFRRRSTLQAKAEGCLQNVCNTVEPDSKMVDRFKSVDGGNSDKENKLDESFDLQKYINDLKKEREMWRQTLQDRRRQRKNISKQISTMQRDEQDLDISSLSETERNFLLIRPNYEHIYEKAKKLFIMATETSIMNEHVTHLHKRCILRAEKKLDDLTTRIINLVD